MIDTDLKLLIKKVQSAQAEFQTIEVKQAQSGAPEKLFDTLSSFSNQNDGGVIVFGISESDDFEITGVSDVQLLQKRVTEQCEQMTPPVRVVFTSVEIDGKNVVAAEVPPVDIADRPCFYTPKGRIKGSYIRVGEADIPMTEYEVYSYEAYKKKYRDDIRVVERAEFTSIDKKKLDSYLFRLKDNKPNLANLDDEQIIELMSVAKDNKPTLSAEMLFGLYPQAFFPQLGIIAVSVPGTEMGESDSDGARFIDNRRIEGTIPEMLNEAMSFVKTNTHKRIIITDGKRADKTEYPLNSVREVILNALVHRDYSVHTEGMPIQLTIYSDRLEVTNPGGLYGRISIDALGKAQPDTRNPVLATALEVMGVTENRYSGIPTIRSEMAEYGLPAPEFISARGEFKVILKNTAEVAENDADKTEKLLLFCRTPRTRAEIAQYLGLSSVSYAIKKHVQPLVEQGLLELSNPKAPGSHNQTYLYKKGGK